MQKDLLKKECSMLLDDTERLRKICELRVVVQYSQKGRPEFVCNSE